MCWALRNSLSVKRLEAGNNFAAVYRGRSKLAPKALDNLRRSIVALSERNYFVRDFPATITDRWATCSRIGTIVPTSKPTEPAAMLFRLRFLPHLPCRNLQGLVGKRHGEDVRPYAPQNVLGDFREQNEFYLGDEADYRDGKFQLKRARDRRLFARMLPREFRHYFDIAQSDGSGIAILSTTPLARNSSRRMRRNCRTEKSTYSQFNTTCAQAVGRFLEGD